jgi:two-component system cell cycle sensor histidine kinase/response regulator CckA
LKPLHLLIVEDSEDDAELILRELERAGFAVSHRRVETSGDMREALLQEGWDLILSDFSMPEFDALAALGVLHESGLDIPLIIVSGTIGEETAVTALRAGALDFILKGKLGRLVPAIERELREHKAREARRLAEEALSESEARLKLRTEELRQRERMFQDLFEAAPDGILLIGSDGSILLANAEAERIFGFEHGRCAGQLIETLFPSGSRDNHVLHPRTYFANPQRRRMGEGLDLLARRADGAQFPVDVSLAPFSLEDRAVALGIVRDMTAQRNVETQLRQAQKMEAVGRLAAGVAHDFNNILSVVLSYAQMMQEDLKTDDPLWGNVEEVRAAGMRAVDLTRQLLTFSRQQVFEAKVLDLNQTIAGMEKMLRRLLGADVKLTALRGPGLWNVKVDPGQIEQVVMNLAVNARDAMPEGGNLTIETKNVELDDEYARVHHDVQPGPFVMLAVTDTGIGIDKETLARIFEPFFTTKSLGKGTGLGLATVFGIVKQSAGHIWVYSEPGRGTTFRVYLPKMSGAPEAHISRPAPESSRGSETILLVEDDEHVRAVARGILRRQGYVVLEAPNGGEALLICEQHGARIHLLLTDVILPRMSGRQLAERLAVTRPEMKVLFMSGYTDDAILQHGILNSGVQYLQKPITPGSLTRKIREVLGPSSGGDKNNPT